MNMPTYLFLFCAVLFSSCDKQPESENRDTYQGKIVGYLQCRDSILEDKTLLGFFIITDSMDSLLSFNVPSSIYDIDTSKLKYGIDYIDGDSISFSFRKADKNEIKHFNCPPSTMETITFYPINNFIQVIITNIFKIK